MDHQSPNSISSIGDIRYRQISDYDIPVLLNQLFDLSQFRNITSGENNDNDKTVASNLEYWNAIKEREINQGQVISFKNFQLTEWIPYSSGQFYTYDALQARVEAENYASEEHNEFTPMGKISMIKGGIGCVRLQPKIILNQKYNILGISSTGVIHEGIPTIINDKLYLNHINNIKENGSILCDLVGRIVLMPSNELIYGNRIPKLCVEIMEVSNIRKSSTPPVATIAIAYRTNSELNFSWTYKTVKPDKKDDNIKRGCEWLKNYIDRYSKDGETSKVFSDFDEHIDWFDDLDLKLKNITKNQNIDTEFLKLLIEQKPIHTNGHIIIGDGNIIIENNTSPNIQINQ